MAPRQASSSGSFCAIVATVSLMLASAGCTVTPEPRTREARPAASATATGTAPAKPPPPDPAMPDLGDTNAADMLEALRWVAALFATGIDTQSETNPLTAWNRADRSAAGAMGSAPAAPDATNIVDGILKRYREGDPAADDPLNRAEKPVDPPTPPPSDPPKDEADPKDSGDARDDPDERSAAAPASPDDGQSPS